MTEQHSEGRDNKGRFEKGKAPGRPPGTQNKLTKTVRQAVLDAFHELQEDTDHKLTSWAKKEPTEFYKIASKLIPTEISGSVKQIIVARIGDENDTDARDGSDNT